MLNLRTQLRKNLARNEKNKELIPLMCLNVIEKHFEGKVRIFGNIKNSILFIKPFPNFAKNQIFLKKQILLEQINERLKIWGYRIKIKDIIIR